MLLCFLLEISTVVYKVFNIRFVIIINKIKLKMLFLFYIKGGGLYTLWIWWWSFFFIFLNIITYFLNNFVLLFSSISFKTCILWFYLNILRISGIYNIFFFGCFLDTKINHFYYFFYLIVVVPVLNALSVYYNICLCFYISNWILLFNSLKLLHCIWFI